MKNHDNKPLILIVDDNQQNLQMLGSILKDKGYRPAMAQDGIKALEFVQKKRPDMILLDIMMPDMDGITVCHQLKKQDSTQKIPVIFITALSETSEKLRAFKAGGVDYITKPFVAEEVLARINVHIELKRALEKLEKMSITDELTGVFNRRFAYEILGKQIKMANKGGYSFVICYLDVDNLKKINDTYDHAEGDKLINTVVNSLKAVLSTSDYLFRMGGDEFLILFSNRQWLDAHHKIEATRKQLNQQKMCGIPIDFSFGLSECHAQEKLSPDELIKKADAMMYQVKMSKKQ
jgi:diguanylate cyclase (GGDEF)-like protein